MIVVNTSPWIALSLCGQNELLQRFYGEVYVPEGVKEELLAGGEKTIGVVELSQYPWVRVDRVFDSKKLTLLHELDRGEAEVIILALEKGLVK